MFLGFAFALVGCTDRAADDGGGDGDTGAATSNASSGSADSAGEASRGDATEGRRCDAFSNEETPVGFTFSVQNARAEAIIIGDAVSCASSYFAVESGSTDVPGSWAGPHCAISCEDVMMGGCDCTADCPSVAPVRIEPGGTYEVSWHGMVLTPVEMPAECASQGCSPQCGQLREVTADERHSITLGVARPQACIDGCECVANADGWCEAQESFVETQPLTLEFTYAPGQMAPVVVE